MIDKNLGSLDKNNSISIPQIIFTPLCYIRSFFFLAEARLQKGLVCWNGGFTFRQRFIRWTCYMVDASARYETELLKGQSRLPDVQLCSNARHGNIPSSR